MARPTPRITCPDNLGSVTSTGTTAATYIYRPYGNVITSIGYTGWLRRVPRL